MITVTAILDIVIGVMLVLSPVLLLLFKQGIETSVKTSAEESIKATFKQINWSDELTRELQKTRGIERQELRYKSYGDLWKRLRPLAIYDDMDIDKKIVQALHLSLSDWYFSEVGGLLLTPQARHFYFALQVLLRKISRLEWEWEVERSFNNNEEIMNELSDLLELQSSKAIEAYNYFKNPNDPEFKDWQNIAITHGKNWEKAITVLADDWSNLSDKQRFITLQQAGSILRTSLTIDLESRVL